MQITEANSAGGLSYGRRNYASLHIKHLEKGVKNPRTEIQYGDNYLLYDYTVKVS